MKYTNKLNLPDPIVKAVKWDDYDPGTGDYTPSSLIRPPYMQKLLKMHENKIVVDVADLLHVMQGKLIHEILHRFADSEVAEQRVYHQIGRWMISMKYDYLYLNKKTAILQDYKYTTTYKFVKDLSGNYPEVPEWEIQLNIGAYILRKKGYLITKLQIVGLLRDFYKSKAKQGNGYPQHDVIIRDMPVWDDKKVEDYVIEKAADHDFAKEAPLEDVLPCTDEETWAVPDKWAVMKKGRKSALKLFDNELAAKGRVRELGPPAFVEHRPGVRKRCEGYCDVSQFCPDYQKFLGAIINE